jgi:hypothetical protein
MAAKGYAFGGRWPIYVLLALGVALFELGNWLRRDGTPRSPRGAR